MKTLIKSSLFILVLLCTNVFALTPYSSLKDDSNKHSEILEVEDTNQPVFDGCVWMTVVSGSFAMSTSGATYALNIAFGAPNITHSQKIIFSYTYKGVTMNYFEFDVHPGQTSYATIHFPIILHGKDVYINCRLPEDPSCAEGCWVTIDG